MGSHLRIVGARVMAQLGPVAEFQAAEPASPADADQREAGYSLDPIDWERFRGSAHAALDSIIQHVQGIRGRPVWQCTPSVSREKLAKPMPQSGRDLDLVVADVMEHIAPFSTGNLHPRFMGWVHGAGTPAGIVAEMLAAGMNMNCGGRDHSGLLVEQQVVRWMAEAITYPSESSGLFVTGSTMANFLALTIAKVAAVGAEIRSSGVGGTLTGLTAYCSDQAHGCITQAMELSGLGSDNLRQIATDDSGRMIVGELARTVTIDRANGMKPFFVVGTAGTVNTGAIDQLWEIAELTEHEGLWFHVDGAIGALAVLSEELAPLLRGLERSQSVAFDFHKWGHVPYDAGFLLVSDKGANLRAFEARQAYLQRADRGLSAGSPWPCDFGLDLSRGFRALKVWMTLEAVGAQGLAAAMEENCRLAKYLAERVAHSHVLDLKAPVALNIVCFGVRGAADDAVNREIVLNLHDAGTAVPSWTTLRGEIVIRCAIVNHRTTRADIDEVFDQIERRAASRAPVLCGAQSLPVPAWRKSGGACP